eukprot:943954_1
MPYKSKTSCSIKDIAAGSRSFYAAKDTKRSPPMLLKIMKDHIETSIVYLNGRYYKHNVGIPQGSIISQLLCCVYVGQFEKKLKKQILRASRRQSKVCRLMMRHVDDFIYFTTSKEEAVCFADYLHQGSTSYNMTANRSKTSTNFQYGSTGSDTLNSEWIAWCGFLWNTRTLNVRVDHRRHTLGIKTNLLTSSLNAGRGEYMLSKLQQLARHKITPLLLSTEINDKSNVIYNLYQSFVVSGYRFVRFVIELEFRNEAYRGKI